MQSNIAIFWMRVVESFEKLDMTEGEWYLLKVSQLEGY